MSTIELSSFYNWCDRRCEQCPVRDLCPVFNASERPVHEIAHLPPPPPLPPLEHALANAGRQWAEAHLEAGGSPVLSMLVAAKTVRVATHEADDDDRIWAEVTTPNLLLLERLLDEARTALAALEARRASSARPSSAAFARFDVADRYLRTFLAPLLAAIPAATRAAIDILAAAGRAPSPFATCAHADADASAGRNAAIRHGDARE